MEVLIIWLGTVVASFGMEMANAMRMFKDVADNGYKIDINRLAEFVKQMNPDGFKTTLMSLLIPMLNIVSVFKKTIQYNNVRPMILAQLDVIDSLEKMTKDEEEQYNVNPTSLNALFITIKSEKNKNKAIKTVIFNDGEERSSISYREDKNGNRIITKTEGPVSKLSVIEQQAKIDEIFSNLAKEINERISKDELKDLLKDGLGKKGNFTLDISSMPVREELTQKTELITVVSLPEQQLEQLIDTTVSNINTPDAEKEALTLKKKYK